MVLDMNGPRRIIAYLENQKKIQRNLTHTVVINRLRKMRMYPKETAVEYISCFEKVVPEYNEMENANALSMRELARDFFNNVRGNVPEIALQ